VRIHPAVIVPAATTSAVLTHGQFSLGVGSGEALNEHVSDARRPNTGERLELLEQAVHVMRQLWTGEIVNHHGRHYTVENGKLLTRPSAPPPMFISGFGPASRPSGRRFLQ
jgi:alkanesulfonate monooxygenase SsuD/methylene tetrahydromethanopterin reductase-like flavin-dependent oxidoreductase (luciferase family)